MNYDRLILELLDRMSALEEEIIMLKSILISSDAPPSVTNSNAAPSTPAVNPSAYTGRDTTKYILNGIRYGKNRLVLAIVKEYRNRHPEITAEELMSVFDKSLQGSLGVIRLLDDVKTSYFDYEKRFFCRLDEIVHTKTHDCVVCTQWGVANIGNIIARAKELGFNITVI